jgi:hypothetical protein
MPARLKKVGSLRLLTNHRAAHINLFGGIGLVKEIGADLIHLDGLEKRALWLAKSFGNVFCKHPHTGLQNVFEARPKKRGDRRAQAKGFHGGS